MANIRYISKETPTQTLNVGGYIFRKGQYYSVGDDLAETLDRITVSGVNIFAEMTKTPATNKIDLTRKHINAQGKLVTKPKEANNLLTITKPDTTKATQTQVEKVIAELETYNDLDREGLEIEAKARKLPVRSNMKDETIIEMLKEHDNTMLDIKEKQAPAADKQVTIKV